MGSVRNDAVTILAGAADSDALVNPGWAEVVEIHAPTTLAETTTITAAANAAGTFQLLQINGANAAIAAATAHILHPAPQVLKIHLGSNAAANRAFTVSWRTLP